MCSEKIRLLKAWKTPQTKLPLVFVLDLIYWYCAQVFRTNHIAKSCETKATVNYFQQSNENCSNTHCENSTLSISPYLKKGKFKKPSPPKKHGLNLLSNLRILDCVQPLPALQKLSLWGGDSCGQATNEPNTCSCYSKRQKKKNHYLGYEIVMLLSTQELQQVLPTINHHKNQKSHVDVRITDQYWLLLACEINTNTCTRIQASDALHCIKQNSVASHGIQQLHFLVIGDLQGLWIVGTGKVSIMKKKDQGNDNMTSNRYLHFMMKFKLYHLSSSIYSNNYIGLTATRN